MQNHPVVCLGFGARIPGRVAAFAVVASLGIQTFTEMGTSVAKAAVVISDGDFNPADWSLTPHPYGVGGGSGSALQAVGLGVPGFARQVTNSFGASFSGSYNANLYIPFTYNPAAGGALSGLSFSIDSRYVDGLSALGFVVQQGAYTWGIGSLVNASTWVTYSITPTPSDFFVYPFGPSGGPQPALPDFSTAGGPITFGFWCGNGSASGGGGSRTELFDNFVVSFVPCPATLGLFSFVGMAALRRRRE